MLKSQKINENILHKFTFYEGEGIAELKKDILKIPDNCRFAGIEPTDEFQHEITFKFLEEKIIEDGE